MKYAQLIRLLVARELTLRYKRSVIGIGWTLLNPMLTSFVLWVVFSFVFASRLPSGQQFAPYLMAGILLNTFFNQGLMQSAESIASNGGVLTKIYVPPQIFAISAALAGLVNFFIGLIPLAIVVFISGQTLAWTLPFVLIVSICSACLAINNVKADVSLVDEVLSVGDGEFQDKSKARMHELINAGAAVVLESHDMKAVKALATRAIWLENGHVKMIGKPAEVVATYEAN